MAKTKVPFSSPWYPYERIEAFNTMRGYEDIPLQLLTYLLDLPDAYGYEPTDDNARPRVRLAKLLWHDGANPLSEPLPTPAQKRSLLFDAEMPVLNTDEEKAAHPKGYRLYAQNTIGQSQLKAKSCVFCYPGRVIAVSPFEERIAIVFEIWTNVNLETNTRTLHYNRAESIEQAILEALHGVNICGTGPLSYSRAFHGDCGSVSIWDDQTNVGRRLTLAVPWKESSIEDELY